MSGPQRTLLAILVFVALVLGSFIWFIATWGDEAAARPTPILLATNIPGSGAAPRSGAAKGTTA
ncbi:hypothetical protein SAMN05421666_2269 [Roseovarius nanhaiticus]|uniref:Uncharacterized protein n=1 Tax=Roseovarius nanhaiticus TaxID=573024 RepID=A0A1N7GZH4_9RHOB|nr:hypothetical protein [Roseovarius nanhaiticus]SEL18880.1 hypothetical protein SAMN05216208_3050 [Roseovarius nanhaiticus]SIS17926.1 hypothetical protein SAMN05421666_2269 [Roseovarius nanhaiticus]